MTIENIITCNGCGEKTNPPKNSGWLRALVIAPDGVNYVENAGDMCDTCKIDFRRWLAELRAKNDAKKAKLQ